MLLENLSNFLLTAILKNHFVTVTNFFYWSNRRGLLLLWDLFYIFFNLLKVESLEQYGRKFKSRTSLRGTFLPLGNTKYFAIFERSLVPLSCAKKFHPSSFCNLQWFSGCCRLKKRLLLKENANHCNASVESDYYQRILLLYCMLCNVTLITYWA